MEKSIEQTFAELDELLEKLESPDTTLEESFACYETGMKLVKACNDKTDDHPAGRCRGRWRCVKN